MAKTIIGIGGLLDWGVEKGAVCRCDICEGFWQELLSPPQCCFQNSSIFLKYRRFAQCTKFHRVSRISRLRASGDVQLSRCIGNRVYPPIRITRRPLDTEVGFLGYMVTFVSEQSYFGVLLRTFAILK